MLLCVIIGFDCYQIDATATLLFRARACFSNWWSTNYYVLIFIMVMMSSRRNKAAARTEIAELASALSAARSSQWLTQGTALWTIFLIDSLEELCSWYFSVRPGKECTKGFLFFKAQKWNESLFYSQQLNTISTVHSEFELDASVARKNKKTVVVCTFQGECNEPIVKKVKFSDSFQLHFRLKDFVNM